jgi:hypothetical protein
MEFTRPRFLAGTSHQSEKPRLASPRMDLQNPSVTRILEPTECEGSLGPSRSVGEEENGHGRPFSDRFSRERQRACEKYRLAARSALLPAFIPRASVLRMPPVPVRDLCNRTILEAFVFMRRFQLAPPDFTQV